MFNRNVIRTEDFLKDIDIKKTFNQGNVKLEQPFSKSEIAACIKTMSNDKAPGLTIITPAFYKSFWPNIGDLVTLAINNRHKNHSFPPRQIIGLVTLIPTQDKDTKYICNIRHITLLSNF